MRLVNSNVFKALSVMLICLIIQGCETNPQTTTNASPGTAEPTLAQRIYYFQHKLIPQWLFESNGDFFFHVSNGHDEQLFSTGAEIINQQYSNNILIEVYKDQQAVLFIFPEPESFPNCYYSLMLKGDDGFSYYTYEKTPQIGDNSIVGVVGGWTKDGDHLNFGARTYATPEAFVQDIFSQ